MRGNPRLSRRGGSQAVIDGSAQEFILTFGNAAMPVALGDAVEKQPVLSARAVVAWPLSFGPV